MSIETPAIHVCDYCKRPIKNGCIGGEHHYVTAGIDRSGEKNFINIVDRKGNRPDLCHTCLMREIARMMNVVWTDDITSEPIMGHFEHYYPSPVKIGQPFLYLPDESKDLGEEVVLKQSSSKITFDCGNGSTLKVRISPNNKFELIATSWNRDPKLIFIDQVNGGVVVDGEVVV